MAEETRPKQRRGFACMDKARVREIAAIGGKRAHELGKAYTWNSKTATKAGAKGGRVRRDYLSGK
jgi:general stress protein YciG